ncbi:MAG: hypothetical protein Q9170_003172 [Blastenia crenularia]
MSSSKDKAHELIVQFERSQQEQLRALRSLLNNSFQAEPIQETHNPNPAHVGAPCMEPNEPREVAIYSIPDEWTSPWSNELLRQRIQQRAQEPGCGGGVRRELADVDPSDAAVRYIVGNALMNLTQFTFRGFYVIDCNRQRQTTLNTKNCTGENMQALRPDEVTRALFKQRTVEISYHRIIEVEAFTPSALSTILLCAAKSQDLDYSTIYAALRRHLSTDHTDRHYNESHSTHQNSYWTDVSESFVVIISTHYAGPLDMLIHFSTQIHTFTIAYFKLTDQPPTADCAPLSLDGVFSIDAKNGKYIREEKFSVCYSAKWKGNFSQSGKGHGNWPSLLLTLNSMCPYVDLSNERFRSIYWIRGNLEWIASQWEKLLDALDAQTTLPSSITFDYEARQKILFEDRNFTNSKKYFWALQSLRVFAEYIEGTLRIMSSVIYTTKWIDHYLVDYNVLERLQKAEKERFEELRYRIERKRLEIQSLSDGVSHLRTILVATLPKLISSG